MDPFVNANARLRVTAFEHEIIGLKQENDILRATIRDTEEAIDNFRIAFEEMKEAHRAEKLLWKKQENVAEKTHSDLLEYYQEEERNRNMILEVLEKQSKEKDEKLQDEEALKAEMEELRKVLNEKEMEIESARGKFQKEIEAVSEENRRLSRENDALKVDQEVPCLRRVWIKLKSSFSSTK